jgi:hypothetical protein
MTAAELISELQKLPPNTRIIVRGYEEGYNDILKLIPMKIKLNVHEHWYEGAHEMSDDDIGIDAVELFGENKNAKDEI